MVTTKLNLSMTEPSVRQIYAKQGDTGRVLDISLDQTPEDGTLRILRPDGVEVTSEAVTGGEVESGGTFESLTEADVTELTAEIEPVQDLNGYDKPWVGGAGKNKLQVTATSQTVSGVTFTVNSDGTIKANGTATARIALALATNAQETPILNESVIMNGCPSGGSTNTYFIQWYGYDGASAVANDTGNGTSAFTPTSTAGVIAIVIQNGVAVNNLVFKPMIRLATETDSTFAPYSNICPITGHDEVTVTRTGINVWDEEWEVGSISSSTGEPITDNTIRCKNFISIIPNTGYAITSHKISVVLYWYDANHTYLSYIQIINPPNNSVVFTTPANAYYMKFRMGVAYGTTYNNDISINYPSTDHDYHAYQGSTYTTSLGQTVYGGTLDMVSGLLTVDKGYYKVTGNENGSYLVGRNNNGNRINFPVDGARSPQYANMLSNIGTPTSLVLDSNRWRIGDFCFFTTSVVQLFVVVPNEYTSFATGIAYLNSVNAEFVYPLAEPVTYQLTAQQIKTLVGTNNVWASSGDIVNVKFTYGGLLSELPSDATEIVGKCYCDVEQNGVSSMPFTLNVKKNERES